MRKLVDSIYRLGDIIYILIDTMVETNKLLKEILNENTHR